MSSSRKNKIRWTPDEENRVVEAACDILENEPFLPFITLLERAMKTALFPERVRPIKVIYTVKWFKPRVQKLLAERQTKKTVKQETTAAKVVFNIADVPTEQLLNETLRRLLFTPLREELTRWIDSSRLITRLSSETVSSLRGVMNTKTAEKPTAENKPRVLIVGLLPEQKNQITKDWDAFFELRFCEGNNPVILNDLARSCEHAVLMSKFCSHVSQTALKNASVTITYCNGGVTDLSRILESVFDKVA